MSHDHIGFFMSTTSPSPRFTEKQGQYLAFIHAYVTLNGRAPAETDMERFFQVTPPSVHSMVIKLEACGFIRRIPRQPRSIELVIAAAELPPLRPQPIKTSVARY
jgi:SOS-response transcriptional repressor LexA